MTWNRLFALAVSPNVVPASAPEKPPPTICQRDLQISSLHRCIVHRCVCEQSVAAQLSVAADFVPLLTESLCHTNACGTVPLNRRDVSLLTKMRRRKLSTPPLLLASERVLAYAVLGHDAPYIERQTNYVNGELLGAVPCIALTENLFSGALNIMSCDERWNVLGVGPQVTSLAEAKQKMERAYPGSSVKWTRTKTNKTEAKRRLREANQPFICSFCGRLPQQVQSVTMGKGACICNICIAAITEPGG